MKEYTCFICGRPFKRYECQIKNLEPTCSKACCSKRNGLISTGKNNGNYKSGIYCNKSICKCGKEKDYRAELCARCAGKSYPKDESSIIHDSTIIEEIKNSKTISEVAKKLKISRLRVCNLIKNKKIDISHFRYCNFRPYTKEKLFCINDKRINSTVKKFILNNNLIIYKCSECEQGEVWNNKPLILELDHKNGNPNDNRLDNLRFLCSNCHSQTDTNKGKNAKRNNQKRK